MPFEITKMHWESTPTAIIYQYSSLAVLLLFQNLHASQLSIHKQEIPRITKFLQKSDFFGFSKHFTIHFYMYFKSDGNCGKQISELPLNSQATLIVSYWIHLR